MATTCGTLEVLRHLVQRLAERVDGRGPALLAAVSALVPAGGPFRVRLHLVQLIGALGTRGFLQGEDRRALPPEPFGQVLRYFLDKAISLGGELLPRGLTTSGLACGLLRSSHAERGALLWASTVSLAETVDQLANEIDVGTSSGFRVGPAARPAF